MERRIVDTAREALHELEAFNASASKTTESDLLADLRPAVEQADSQADRVALIRQTRAFGS
jgi:hypothetical protein